MCEFDDNNKILFSNFGLSFILFQKKTSQVKVEDIEAYAPKDLLIVTTGSQVS